VIRDRLHTAHVGDSRIYMLRSGQLRQLTVDHTWVQGALDHNIISAEEARDHPYAHMLQRAIGSPEPPDADFRLRYERDDDDRQAEARQALPLRAGDRILLCSDGLTDLVEDKEIRASLLEQGPEDAVQSLISLARARGGHDNITALVLEVPEGISPSQAAVGNRLLGFAGLLLLLALLLALGVVALWQLELLPWP
jgi:protein phosphatase